MAAEPETLDASLVDETSASASADASVTHAATHPPPSSSGSTTIGSPLEALERDEILRTRKFCYVGAAIAIVGASGAAVLPGDPTATLLVVIAASMTLVAAGFLLHRTADPLRFRLRSTMIGWYTPAICVTSAIPYFGAFSPAPILLVLGIYFTGLGKNTRLAYTIYAILAGAQLLVSVLVISGATHDTGLIHAELARRDEILVQVLVQFVLAATLVTARMSRKTALVAVGELERAVRIAAHREALLLEAREELERALRSGRGRFTDQTLGHYQLGTVIGRGAMGEVYEATDPRSSERVAVKVLSQASLSNPNHVLRFLRELRTAVGIDSPHVVRVIEVGETPLPYLVMERLEGVTLGEILRGKRALSAGEVADLVTQIGAGITAAAHAGIVHRDLKPQNLFLHRGTWKILDFGVARAIDSGDTLTAGHVVGTPSYMAPEQASGGTVDHCTDLYALAAIAYRSLTGHPPYAAGEIAETLYRVVHTRPRRPGELVPNLPYEVDLVLAIGMARRPTDRFSAAVDFAGALVEALDGRLSSHTRDRGEALLRSGAWMTSRRASTENMRARR